ncbi:hypothetical protein [Novosphingobium sp. Rr 2-17]|uniref:hypothetical protein n=1 Tax=Novosphingobium sp. Rr 2-17 TaxID=555793 RepID=UPI0012F69845|nr:hypothetical protein [Novosphingobium sp. Rr 2-17]
MNAESNAGRGRFLAAATAATVLACITSPHLALAQEGQNSGTWSLPPGAGQSTPTPQGPVDSQNPSLRPNREAAPTTTPSAPPSPVPVIAAPPPPPAANTASQRPRAEPSSPPSAAVEQTPTEQTPAQAAAPASSPAPEQQPSTAAPSVSTPTPPADAAEAPTGGDALAWWWIALPLALVGIAAALWLRRHTPADPQPWDETAGEETAEVEPATPSLMPEPAPVVTRPQSAPTTPLPDTVDIAFEPISLRLSLVYATLQFRLTLTATTARSTGQLVGDMIAAHGSLSQEEQLAPSPETLELIKAVPSIAANETITVTGEVRLPLAAVRSLERGAGRYMVPLVRLCLLSDDAAPVRRVFSIGTLGTGTALSPVRLDTGPRMVGDLGTREVEAARALTFASPPRRAAG